MATIMEAEKDNSDVRADSLMARHGVACEEWGRHPQR